MELRMRRFVIQTRKSADVSKYRTYVTSHANQFRTQAQHNDRTENTADKRTECAEHIKIKQNEILPSLADLAN